MNKGYGEGYGMTKKEQEREKFLAKRKQNEEWTEKSAKRTPEIPGKDDGVSLEPNHLANVKEMDIPFNKDSINRDQNDSGEIVDPSTEGGMEDWLDKKIEAEKNDPSLNPEKGVVVGNDYIIKDGEAIKDKIGEFGEEIENMENEDLYNRGDDWHGVEEGVSDENVVGTEKTKEGQVNNFHDVNFETSQEIKTTKRGMVADKIADKKEFAFLRAPTRGFNSKYPGKDNPKGLEQIKTKSSVRKFWDKLTGKE